MSYNSTGLDSAKVHWINEIMRLCNIDCFQLQEHFKVTKSLESFFKKEFSKMDSFVMPAHREIFQESGRAKGGLAQLVSKTLDIKKEKIPTNHWRLQAQVLHISDYKLMWINCYFPTDPHTLQFDDQELISVLDELENILDNNNFEDCIIGGDLNYDMKRNTGFAATVKDFATRIGVKSVWEKFPVDFTHLHTDMKSTSTLDHFLLNQNLLDKVVDAAPVHLGDNVSRHSPIMLKVLLPSISARSQQPSPTKPRSPAWYKASQEQKDLYCSLLQEKLSDLTPPPSLSCSDATCQNISHSEERDKHVLDILCSVVETSYECIPLTARQGPGRTPDTSSQPLPGWNEKIAPLKSDSRFWHSVWISAGRPTAGSLYMVMCHTRSKYHRAVRVAKREAATVSARELSVAAEAGDMNLLKEMKKTLSKKNKGQLVPESLEGKVTNETILDKFKDCYEALYNSAATEDTMTAIKEKLKEFIDENSGAEVGRITGQLVKQACCRMKPGKADVTGAFSSDVFLNGPDLLFDLLASAFQSFIIHGSVTSQMLCCAFLPLFKGGLKNPEKFDSYRAIAGASQLLKLFEYVILILWGDHLDVDSLQFGFRAGASTTQCTWLVNEVTTYFMRRGTAVNACLLDCSKAFDKCRFDKLFSKLISKGLPHIVVRVLIYIYEEQTGWVKLGGMRSQSFKISNGTRQGSVLSPILFSVYLDDLLRKLRGLQLGCHIGGYWLGGCGYADDLILLAPSRDVLQRMLEVCETYASEHNLVFSTDPEPAKSKTKCMYFCGRLGGRVRLPAPLYLDGKALPWVDTAEHLGHTLHQSVTMDKDCLRARGRFIAKTVEIRDQLSFAQPQHILQAVQVMCTDAYGCMLWDLGSDTSEQFFKSWNTCVKLCHGVTRSTFTYLVEGWLAADIAPLRNQVMSRYAGFYRKLLFSPSREIRALALMVTNDPRSTTYKNLRLLRNMTGLSQPHMYSGFKIKASLPVKSVPEKEKWRLGLLSSLFKVRSEMYLRVEDTKSICSMIDSLCST